MAGPRPPDIDSTARARPRSPAGRTRPAADRAGEQADTLARFRSLVRLERGDPRRPALRRLLITEHMPYARHLASRYGSGPATAEDLYQVAYVGLVRAVDDFDPEYGVPFLGYAAPTILGELKRYFRDASWPVHVPRRVKELSSQVRPAAELLRQRLNRDPTNAELAAFLGAPPRDVLDATAASRLRTLVCLDAPLNPGDGYYTTLGDLIGAEDPGMGEVVDRETLRPLLAQLPPRDRQILVMSFVRQMSQTQIGAELGVSQMQISRQLASILGGLRQRAQCAQAC